MRPFNERHLSQQAGMICNSPQFCALMTDFDEWRGFIPQRR